MIKQGIVSVLTTRSLLRLLLLAEQAGASSSRRGIAKEPTSRLSRLLLLGLLTKDSGSGSSIGGTKRSRGGCSED